MTWQSVCLKRHAHQVLRLLPATSSLKAPGWMAQLWQQVPLSNTSDGILGFNDFKACVTSSVYTVKGPCGCTGSTQERANAAERRSCDSCQILGLNFAYSFLPDSLRQPGGRQHHFEIWKLGRRVFQLLGDAAAALWQPGAGGMLQSQILRTDETRPAGNVQYP